MQAISQPLTEQQRSLHALRWSYLTAFALIILLAVLAQGLIQFTLFKEIQSRQAATILSSQAVHSERIGRDIILLLVPGKHASVIAEMQSDLSGEETNRLLFGASYGASYPSIAQIDGGHGRALHVYQTIRTNAYDMLRIAQEAPAQQKRDNKQLRIAATAIFYAQPEQLRNIQMAQSIVDEDTDSYIHLIQLIELILFSMTVLVLAYEVLFVMRPAIRRITQAEQEMTEQPGASITPSNVQPI